MIVSSPGFYEQAPVVRTYDPSAAMLGAARDGLLDYHYLDAGASGRTFLSCRCRCRCRCRCISDRARGTDCVLIAFPQKCYFVHSEEFA